VDINKHFKGQDIKVQFGPEREEMSDRLEGIKTYVAGGMTLALADRDWLIAEVERLSLVEEECKLALKAEKKLKEQIESITKERDEWQAKCEIDIRIEQCVITDREDLPIMEYIIKRENQGGPIEFKTIQKINLIGYRILPLEDFKKIEAENAELRKQLVICDEVDDETQIVLNHYEKLIAEVESLVIEINSIKAERNAVIKAHADLLSECHELKTQL